MSLLVAVVTADTIVFGADSAISMSCPASPKMNISANVDKIHQVSDLPMAIMNIGCRSANGQTYESLLDQWHASARFARGDQYTVEQVYESLCDGILARHQAELELIIGHERALVAPQGEEFERWIMRLVVGGFSSDSYRPWLFTRERPFRCGECYGIVKEMRDDTNKVVGTAPGVCSWGYNHAIQRLMRGAEQYRVDVDCEHLPIRDAIDLCEFLIDTAIGYERFKFGPAYVQGAIDIAVVRANVFQWYRRKPPIGNS